MASAAFEKIQRFLTREMRMAHVYQPVMIRAMLEGNGKATVAQVAGALLAEDRSQLEYYQQITKTMVGRVLVKNRRIATKEGDIYKLVGHHDLTVSEVESLIEICDEKIDSYVQTRGDKIWSRKLPLS